MYACVSVCMRVCIFACVYACILRFLQLAVAVNSVVIGNVVPWINLSFNRVTSLTAARTRDTFACVAALATSLASIAETDDGDDDEGRSVSQRLQQVPPLLMALMLLAM